MLVSASRPTWVLVVVLVVSLSVSVSSSRLEETLSGAQMTADGSVGTSGERGCRPEDWDWDWDCLWFGGWPSVDYGLLRIDSADNGLQRGMMPRARHVSSIVRGGEEGCEKLVREQG